VEDVAAVHEGGIGDQAVGREPGQGELGSFAQQRADVAETGVDERVPSSVVVAIRR
jgi:hypothetical protein